MQKSTAYHPAVQLIFLVLMAFIGAIVFTILGGLFWFFTDPNASLTALTAGDPAMMSLNFLRYVQISSSIGMFIAGPIAFAYLNEVKPKSYYYFDQPVHIYLLILVVAIMFFSNPLLEYITVLNQKMSLPDALKSVEIWMKNSEKQAAELTKKLLAMKGLGDLTINLVMIAIIPAIGEELFFRGGIQNILGQWFKNHHAAIWVTAIIFSSIHMQFYGFFPRMFLGALFGYLLVYGKNIWLAILGHFLNNGTAVVMAYIMQKQGKSLDELDQGTTFEWMGYTISTIFTVALLILFFKKAKEKQLQNIYE
ncbi:MAG: CPBP family intramembrane glutamic endopeptidase [Pelobium sp.]